MPRNQLFAVIIGQLYSGMLTSTRYHGCSDKFIMNEAKKIAKQIMIECNEIDPKDDLSCTIYNNGEEPQIDRKVDIK